MKTATTFLACILSASCLPALAASSPYRVAPAPAWVARVSDAVITAPGKAVEAGDSDFPLVDHQVLLSTSTSHYQRFAERIISEADVDSAAQVSIDIDPEHELLSLHQVRVFRKGRFIDKLATARRSLLNREEGLEEGLIDGRVTLHVLLQDIRIGDVLDYSYTIERNDPISERGYNDWFSTQWGAPVRYFRLRVLRPEGRRLYVLDKGAVGEPLTISRDGWTETRWEAHDIATLHNDTARPGWHIRYPRIEVSEFGSWNAVRDWALPMYVVTQPPDEELAAFIDQVRGEPDEARRILRALRFVQDDIRYTGIEVGAGAYRPTQPGVVLARRYGDCKDKTLLLVTVLRAVGVQAWPALVHSSMGKTVRERQPSPGAFDHVIAKVQSHDRTYWLDATASGQGGLLDEVVQADYGPALVIATGADGLEQIPARTGRKPTSNVYETFDFRQGTSKTAHFTVRTQFRDEDADEMRVRMRSQTQAQLGQDYLDYYRKSYDGIRATRPLEVKDDRDRNLLTIEESYEIDEPFEKDDDGGLTFRFEAYLITEQMRKPEQTVRTSPLARSFPKHVHHEIVAYLPGEWNIEGNGVTVKDPAFEYHSRVEFHGGKLELAYDLRNIRDHVPVSGLKRFLTRLDKVRNDAFYTLTEGTTVAAATARSVKSGSGRADPSTEMLAALGLGIGFAVIAVFELRRWRLPAPAPGVRSGLLGWMLLPLTVACLAPFVYLVLVWKFLRDYGSAAAFAQVSESLQYLVLLEFLFVGAGLVLALYCLRAISRRDRRFPHAFILLCVVAMVAMVLDVVQLRIAADVRQIDRSLLMLGVLASGAIGIAYMSLSQRVRATFGAADGEDYLARPVPRELVSPQ